MNNMKKTYRTPKAIVAHISGTETILAGSDPNSLRRYDDEEVDGSEALSKKGYYDLWGNDEN